MLLVGGIPVAGATRLDQSRLIGQHHRMDAVADAELGQHPGDVMLAGMICLGIAVLRARALPRWVGVLFVVVPFLGAAGPQGAVSLAPDHLLFIGLFTVGVTQLREIHAPLLTSAAQRSSQVAASG
jgi:hypothetical protein